MAYEIDNSGQPKKSNKKKWLWILGLGIITAGVSVFGYRYYKKNKQTTTNDNSAPDFKAQKPKAPAKVKAPTKTSAKTTSKAGNPPPSANKVPNQAGQTNSLKPIDAKQIGLSLHAAAVQKDFAKVYDQLSKIKSTSDYSAVNKVFSSQFLNGVHQTIITGLLGTFKDPKQKETLRKSFIAIGLKYSDKTKKWSLSGIEQSTIITTTATKVWKDPQTAVPVPINMVLGKQLRQQGNFTLFENEGQYFLVDTKHIKAYNS